MAQQPDYAYLNERIDFIKNTLENAQNLYNRIKHGENEVAFEDYSELRKLYYEVAGAITNYFDYLHTYAIPQKNSYLFQWLYGKYYQIEVLDEIDSLLEELDEQVDAEEIGAN
jgi:hypothetical protein